MKQRESTRENEEDVQPSALPGHGTTAPRRHREGLRDVGRLKLDREGIADAAPRRC